jgi:hypothetical protein
VANDLQDAEESGYSVIRLSGYPVIRSPAALEVEVDVGVEVEIEIEIDGQITKIEA